MEKNHTKTANIQPTIASESIGYILPCSSLDSETERTGKYAIPNDGYIPEQSNACSWPLWPFTVGIDHLLTHKFLHKIARTASNVCIEHNSGVHKPLLFSFFGIESPLCREYLVNTAADLGGGCRGCAPPPPGEGRRFSNTTGILPPQKTMWFIGVEVEQETSAHPPKKNPGSAPRTIRNRN